eukprot:4448524-Prymnesium_polylepis.1
MGGWVGDVVWCGENKGVGVAAGGRFLNFWVGFCQSAIKNPGDLANPPSTFFRYCARLYRRRVSVVHGSVCLILRCVHVRCSGGREWVLAIRDGHSPLFVTVCTWAHS